MDPKYLLKYLLWLLLLLLLFTPDAFRVLHQTEVVVGAQMWAKAGRTNQERVNSKYSR